MRDFGWGAEREWGELIPRQGTCCNTRFDPGFRDIIIGSWCGKKFKPEQVIARAGWDAIPAVRDGQLFEIKSPLILTPGPAALTEGAKALQRIIGEWVTGKPGQRSSVPFNI